MSSSTVEQLRLPLLPEGLRFVDLFAGIGGFHHALGGPGFEGECVLAVEYDPTCQAVYRAAFPETDLVGDIRSITRRPDGSDATIEEIQARVPEHDVLCAGFPCQPFSKSGAQLGIRDQIRGTLFFDIMEIVRARHPRYLILENVPNLVGPNHRSTWSRIITSLRSEGYRVSDDPVILSPHRLPPDIGSPQVRDRVFILAEHVPESEELGEEALIGRPPVDGWDPRAWTLDSVIDPADAGAAYALRETERAWLDAWDAFVKGVEADRLPGFPIWVDAWSEVPVIPPGTPLWKADFLRKNAEFYGMHKDFLDGWLATAWDAHGTTVREFPASRRKFEWQAREVHPTREGRTIWDLLVHLRPSGIRVKAANYVPALVAITQTSIVGSLARRLTPREAARLQQIPFEPFEQAGVSDADIYRQLGNAVNVGAVRFVAQRLLQRDLEAEEAHPAQLTLLTA